RLAPVALVLGAWFLLLGVVLSVPGTLAQSGTPMPPQPAEPKAAKAYAVLETHCARCHQQGKLAAPAASTGFLDVLALDAVARDPSLVRPGVPDASPLYTTLLRRAMPPDGWRDDAAAGSRPTFEEMEAVRDWIESLPPQPAGACKPTPLVKP